MARRSMVAAAMCDYSNAKCFGKSSRARCMENNFPHSITSPVSNEPVELLVRLNSNSLWSVHVLDHRRPRTRAIPLHVSGHLRAIRPQLGAWENPSARGGVLDVGGRFCSHGTFIYSFDSGRLERCARIARSLSTGRRKRFAWNKIFYSNELIICYLCNILIYSTLNMQ